MSTLRRLLKEASFEYTRGAIRSEVRSAHFFIPVARFLRSPNILLNPIFRWLQRVFCMTSSRILHGPTAPEFIDVGGSTSDLVTSR